MAKRKGLSKKRRFAIFKRDGFRCVYCGRTSAEICLQVDHVVPVIEGGTNDETNLVTACVECNQGKGRERINQKAHASVIDPKIMEKEQELKELEHYAHLTAEIEKAQEETVWNFARYWEGLIAGCPQVTIEGENCRADKRFLNSLRVFIRRLEPDQIFEAMEIGASRFSYSGYKAWKYSCGIMWKRIKGRDDE